ncbi:NAD(P)-dependent oxidoreductase [Comamonas aquatica]|mgnify:CR=1 FL=1|jgi:UDP-glucuronate 4-epimerase|uniref:NAD(P)-dependent oxidoreductase n=1 Tax=Comamonas aquatica TaxID=225991 RepID=A0AA42W5Q8_9BURK|nr:NAD(P)-dependent oxidoreductase [Comamonas aquatica]MDH1427370.1 NAD(P)-dependent oxidoreductase [Comamonas aquatica]MDH1607255.1 NAD(P)-dependent oxidoreductase [Comamonas aquatica]MDH1619053.1 NAD(P)-dependent oxidoreductase [Comamonas aquatica]MDH2006998.1 NAD(P)-dependent oxidoreductase [Comamonas aquatica]
MSGSVQKPILITGAAGLVGSTLAERLVKAGRPVIALDRYVQTLPSGVAVQACDLGDIHRLHAIAKDGIEAIIHCGAYSGPMVARDSPYSMVQVNIVGTANMLELARVHSVRRFIYCSSTSAYGKVDDSDVVVEGVPLRPASLYGASKVASEYMVTAYSDQYDVSGVNIRLSWVYGPRRTTDCIIRTMIENAQASRPTRMAFGLDFPRQFIHVNDAVDGLLLALDVEKPASSVYNITGDTRVTLGEIARLVRSVHPDADIELQPGDDPVDEIQAKFSIEAARQELKYTPKISLAEGIATYSKWLAEQKGAAS